MDDELEKKIETTEAETAEVEATEVEASESQAIEITAPVEQTSKMHDDKERFYLEKIRGQRITIFVVAMLLVFCCVFAGYQAQYIFRLANGEEGIMNYDDNSTNETETGDGVHTTVEATAEPWFALEEAASVTDPNKETLSTVEIVNMVSPATITVYVYSMEGDVETRGGSGSGFLITEDGYIVTNAHVVTGLENQTSVRVAIPGHSSLYDAEIVGIDEQTDIAVLKIESDESLPFVTLGDSDMLQAGELVIAIGNPLGSFAGTVTVGVVSAAQRDVANNGYSMTLIQTDASINSGNSGGPLINSFGEVIGVTNAKIASAEGMGFAIPINSIKDVVESIINYGYVTNRPYIGITAAYVTADSYYGAVEGVYVNEVVEGGPADDAGLCVGDRILTIDGVVIVDSSDMISARDAHVAGDEMIMVVERDGEEITVSLILGDSALANE